MEHYVTLFDSLFLPQGMALHASMQRHVPDHTLWVVCVDETAFTTLTRLQLPNCVPLRLSDFDEPALARVEPQRSRGEFCWTLTPFAPRFVFQRDPSVGRATYLDADLWFRKHPAPVFAELDRAGAQVLITDHGYSPEYDQSATSGQYCVQFMTFTRDGGEPVRRWWEDKCVDWCFARFEDGRFGDQKYLDDWPERFGGLVHVLQRQEFAQAPWNANRFPYGQSIFFHFQGLRILPGRQIDFGPDYPLPRPLRQYVYEPYVKDLTEAIARLEGLGLAVRPQAARPGWLRRMRRRLSGVRSQGWRYNLSNFRAY